MQEKINKQKMENNDASLWVKFAWVMLGFVMGVMLATLGSVAAFKL